MSVPATTKPAPPAAQLPARTSQNSVIVRMAERFGMEPVAFERTIRGTIFPSDKKDASPEQMAAFLVVADQYQLNPFTKEIYAFPNKAGGITPIVGIDGWIKLVNRHPQYRGFTQDYVHDETFGDGVRTTMHRADWDGPVAHTEWLNECKRPTPQWEGMPGRMLGHKSFIQTARKAFGLAGIYDEDEAAAIRDIEAKDITPRPAGMAGLRARLGGGEPAAPESSIEHAPADDEAPAAAPDRQPGEEG